MFDTNSLDYLRKLETEGRAKIWWDESGQPHRDGGPAVKTVGVYGAHEEWIQHGVYHRTDGPAIIGASSEGGTYIWWWIDNIRIKNWTSFQQEGKLPDEEIILLKLKWGNNGF